MDFRLSKKTSDYIWINGQFIKWEDACIHVLTHSLHYAGAVFEGLKSYDGKIFKFVEHTNRLFKSAENMFLKIEYSLEDIKKATYDLLEMNNLKNAYIRPLIWRGADSIALYSTAAKTNFLIMAQESNHPFVSGLKLCVSPWRKVDNNAFPVQCKSSAHYAMALVSQKIAKNAGYDDALILDPYDEIAECTTSNIFFVKDNILITPIADRFLDGITRQTALEIGKTLNMKVKEARLSLDDIENYDSCFITGTAAEIRGVSSINLDNKKIEFNKEAIIIELQQEYAKVVGKKI